MAGLLPKPVLTDLERSPGSMSADLSWTAQSNNDQNHHMRVRFIARTDGSSTPAPTLGEASLWPELLNAGGLVGDFVYVDTIRITQGVQRSSNPAVMPEMHDVIGNHGLFVAGNTVWVTARLEIA